MPPAKGMRQPVASKPLLDCFWNLADVEPTARVEAASQLLALLAADPTAEGGCADAELSPELAYALGRLIKGLASSRDCARQGFALALAQLLRAFPAVTPARVLDETDKELQAGSKEREQAIGYFFAHAAIVRSGRLLPDAASTAAKGGAAPPPPPSADSANSVL
ncbi:hypothetical protein T492DRAFT_855890 [Pavlovales sp. CCMP2436]|nr:hypothetical protein T492DRAFT_855890 [Pavlovales sp. CCMP2436]